jgi:3-isopropylmalate/(R)-2-methylmalate dehydratase small subunit
MRITGNVLVLRDGSGALINDIDTDQIYHNKHLAVTDVREMGKYALGNLKGYEDLPRKAGSVQVLVAGDNFGSGSSRQQAVDCFKALSIKAVLVRSVGAIYKRNAINAALAIFILADGEEALSSLPEGTPLTIDTGTCEIMREGTRIASIRPPSKVQMDILESGGLFEYGRRTTEGAKGNG